MADKKPTPKAGKKKRRRERSEVSVGKVYVQATFNNTIVTITDLSGDVIVWGSAGGHGFKGSKKSTPYAAQVTGQAVGSKAVEAGVRSVSIFVKGPGVGRESAIRALEAAGLRITSIKDVTPVPHNGCRARKRRRL